MRSAHAASTAYVLEERKEIPLRAGSENGHVGIVAAEIPGAVSKAAATRAKHTYIIITL